MFALITTLLISLHLIGVACCLGTRLVSIPIIRNLLNEGTNERLDELAQPLKYISFSDIGLAIGVVAPTLLMMIQGVEMSALHWALKLKFILFFLLVCTIGAFHIAKSRAIKHYDAQMIPALQHLNSLAVTLMCCMVLFTVLSL